MSARELAAAVVVELRRRPATLANVERCLCRIAPNLPPGGFAAVLNHLPAWMQPRLHRDADAIVAAEGAHRR